MKYQIITVKQYINWVENGYIRFDDKLFKQHYRGYDLDLELVRDMLNGMLKDNYSYLVRAYKVGGHIELEEHYYVMKMFYEVLKYEVEKAEKKWNLYYCSEAEGFTANANLSPNNIPCGAILSTVVYLNEKKRIGEELMKGFDKVYMAIQNYPLCFAVVDKF